MHACKTAGYRGIRTLLLAGSCVIAAAGITTADVQLVDLGSEVWINPDSQAGVYDWIVSGQDQLYQQWYWVEVNGQRFSIDAIGPAVVSQPTANTAVATYNDAVNNFSLEVSFELTGTDFASAQSLLKEAVTIQNNSGSDLNISLVMYSDFDLGNTLVDEAASLWGLNDSHFVFGDTKGWTTATQTNGVYSHSAIFNGWPLLGEIGVFDATLTKLNTTLDPLDADASAVLPLTAGSTTLSEYGPFGPGDMTYAVQWDFVIVDGDSAGIGVDKRLVTPEPGTAMLSLIGLVMLLRVRKRAN